MALLLADFMYDQRGLSPASDGTVLVPKWNGPLVNDRRGAFPEETNRLFIRLDELFANLLLSQSAQFR